MIYLTNGNMPLNAAYVDEIVQEDNSTYQLSFRFPTSDSLWEQLKEETFLTADDLHGEQDFVIFEVEKKHGYIQVYANQVFTLLNNYVVNPISLDRQTGSTALSRFAGSITRDNPFSFFSDIEDRHTFNVGSKNAMEAFAKDKHSIIGQWGGDLVRHGYQVRLLKNGGSENESLFMYKKNLSSYQHKTSTKSLKTRITFIATVKGEGEKAPDRTFTVTIDSPLINKYSQIYEDVIEVNDQDVKDEASLRKYGEQYYRTSLCDMMEDSLELEVVGQSDVPVQMFDIVSLFHDVYNLDVRKKITKYTYSPMGKKLKTIGFGQFKSGLANAIGNAVSDAVKGEAQQLQDDFERQLARELKNADLVFDRKTEELKNEFEDGLNATRAKAEEVKQELSDTINQRFNSFDNGPLQEVKRRAEEALRNAGASSLLAQEAKQISERARADITNLQTSSQNALSQIESFKNQYGTKLNEVKSTADGILTKLGTIETYVNKDGQRQERLQRYARDESARQVSAIREQISRDYVGKSTYQEDVRGLERRFSAISTQTNDDIDTKIAQYKQTVDGQFASITSQISGKVNQTDFQRVRETSQLYERIIGINENDIADKVARMALSNQLFQVEVAKNFGDNRNYVKNADFREKSKSWQETNVSGLNFNYGHSTTQRGKSGVHIYGSAGTMEFYGIYQKFKFEGSKNDNVILSFLASKDGADDFSGIKIGIHCRKNNAIISQMWRTIQNSEIARFSYKKISLTFNLPVDVDEINLMFYGEQGKVVNLYISEIKFEKGSNATSFTLAPEDTEEAVRTVQSQLAGSWSVQNINSAGDLISGINLGANGHNRFVGKLTHITGETLIDKAVIKSAMVDKLKTANFESGSVTTTILDAEAVTADKVRMDQAFAKKLVASNIFTDTLAAKEAFINKLRSVVVTATLLEGYKGKIGGFQIGTHEKDSSVYWITGQNQFSVGMSNGSGQWNQTALWVNWGNDWMKPSDTAWYVKNTGQMFCYNRAEFWSTPIIHGDLQVTGHIFYNNKNSGKSGYWIHSSKYSNFEPSDNYLYLYYSGSGYDWIPMNKEISDRRYKHNIEASTVSGLDIIQKLGTYSYRKEYDGKIEDISCGIMAQDVQKYIPEAFYENPDGAYSYRTFELVPYLIKAIQELNQKLEEIA